MPLPRRLVLRCAAALPLAGTLHAARPSVPAEPAPGEVSAELARARLHGQGRLTVFGLRVYDARLWTTEGFSTEHFEQHAFALELQYLRRLAGAAIAERSLAEMQRLGDVAPGDAQRWLAAMVKTFPDVREGDRIVGVHRPGSSARFFLNGRLLDEIADAGFARRFFAIWLSPRTSQPTLRAALLAGTRGTQ